MPTVATSADAYQDLDRIRERIEYGAGEFYDDNAELRFDELLVELEKESRGIFETLWGDETPLSEVDRVDTIRATDDAALALVYPIQQIREVETRQSVGDDWETLDADNYTATEHKLILATRDTSYVLRRHSHANPLGSFAGRGAWVDLASSIRVTYDRGFDPIPTDILSIQITLINRMLRQLRGEQTVAAADPGELGDVASQLDNIVNDDIRRRIGDVTSPGLATVSV